MGEGRSGQWCQTRGMLHPVSCAQRCGCQAWQGEGQGSPRTAVSRVREAGTAECLLSPVSRVREAGTAERLLSPVSRVREAREAGTAERLLSR